MQDYVGDLEALVDRLDSPPVLVGHSMGGLLAQMLASRRTVRALVLLAPSAPWGVMPATPFEFASAQALYFAGDFWNKRLWPTHWIAAANALDNVPEGERQAVLDRFVPESGLATFEIMHWAMDLKRATQIDPRDIACPILCVAGERDRVNSPGTVRSVAQRYRGRARFEQVEGFSHSLIGESGWENIAGLALDWLDDVLANEPSRSTTR
jgi:pimeloyl-ACP methyl ester carboxylesterase